MIRVHILHEFLIEGIKVAEKMMMNDVDILAQEFIWNWKH